MKGNPTLNDVAEMADVSIATVSRVLNQNGYVSSENRLKIEAAITKLGYRGRSSNKTFKRKKSRLIAIITSTSRVHTFLPRLTYALSIAANQAGYFTLGIHRSADNETLPELVNLALENNICGMVFTDFKDISVNLQNIDILLHCGVPVVLVERAVCSELNSVKIDTRQGVYMAARHLLDSGRKNIIYISAPISGTVEQDRLDGFRQALLEKNISADNGRIHICNSMAREDCYMELEKIFKRGPAPDGVVEWSDVFGIAAMQYFNRHKIKVPEDVAVVGYDDFLASHAVPPMSSVKSPLEDMAAAAINIIHENNHSGGEFFARTVALTPKLIVRESSRIKL